MSKTLPGLPQAFEPLRQGLKRVLVEAEDRDIRQTALTYYEATDQIIEMSVSDGTLEGAARSELVSNLQTQGVTVEAHVSSRNWPLALGAVYTLLTLPGLILAPPPGPPITRPDKPLPLPESRPDPKPKSPPKPSEPKK